MYLEVLLVLVIIGLGHSNDHGERGNGRTYIWSTVTVTVTLQLPSLAMYLSTRRRLDVSSTFLHQIIQDARILRSQTSRPQASMHSLTPFGQVQRNERFLEIQLFKAGKY